MLSVKSSIQYVVLAAVVLSCVAPVSAWWNSDWPYRRAVFIPQPDRPRMGGEDFVVVTIPTGGLIRPDGSDIRVATTDDVEVPHRVLQVGPGDTVRLVFSVRAGTARAFVYFGHPDPPKPTEWDPRRGVLLQTWAYRGGNIRTLEEVQKVFAAADTLIGCDYRDRIFLGHNPFGPQNRIASMFTAYIMCPRAGKYTFAISSRDASFLLVDDTLVVENGGTHGPQRDVGKQGDIELTAGLHKLTFYHVNTNHDPVAVVAWRPPGQKDIEPIPELAFTPIVRGQADGMHKHGQPLDSDFTWEHAGETFMQDRYYQRFVFSARRTGSPGPPLDWTWDFGDGQTATGQKVQHVYLVDGEYTVTLTGKSTQDTLVRTNRIAVQRPWDTVTQNTLDPVRMHGEIVSAYDFATLPAEAIGEAMLLLKRTQLKPALIRAGSGLVARDKAPAAVLEQALPILAETLIEEGRLADAAEAYKQAARMTPNPAVCAELLMQAGRVTLDHLQQADQARALFEQVVRAYDKQTTAPAIRLARIGIGDCYRAGGNYELALQAYTEAGVGEEAAARRAPILRGHYARHVEDYLRRGDLDAAQEYLDKWQTEFPADKLEGYWSLLRVKLHHARGEFGLAAREAQTLVAVNPTPNYGPELMMLAAAAYESLNQADAAKSAYKTIVDKFPESPLATQAAMKAN